MRFTGQVFTADVTLDYNEFIDCEFRNCAVLFHGGTFSLVRARFHEVRFGLGDAADRTLAFLRLIRAQNPAMVDELLDAAPGPAPDQSVTIN